MEKEKARQIVNEAEEEIKYLFKKTDEIAEYNQEKVLNAFRRNKIGEEHFYTVTGYGHDDLGREALDNVFKDTFNTEAAIVRPHFVSGTHTIACALFGVLRPNDALLSIAGSPFYFRILPILSMTCGRNFSRFPTARFLWTRISRW